MKRILIIGGGAAGFFSAIQCKTVNPDAQVILADKASSVLAKVKISGGGRCNVTHACFDPRDLSGFYPRGGKALIGAFHTFQPRDTMAWFESHGVPLKIEPDGRVFPVSNSSQSIVDCLCNAAESLGVQVWTGCGINSLDNTGDHFVAHLSDGKSHAFDRIIFATGSSRPGYALAEKLGHTIVTPVPSLFTFTIQDLQLRELAGLSVQQAKVMITGMPKLVQEGPILITHWGLSGPAIIRLSAWAARELSARSYQFEIKITWINEENTLSTNSKKIVAGDCPFKEIPSRLWRYLVRKSGISVEARWCDLSIKSVKNLEETLGNDTYQVSGKGVFKEEFVTAGGVLLKEVNFKTMESTVCPGLHFAGEILDVDGITGGFNFQNAWTTGYLAGSRCYD